MATKNIIGILRSDADVGSDDLIVPGVSFLSDNQRTLQIELGADDTVFSGDGVPTNEVPQDLTQTFDDGNGTGAFAYDFTVELIGSDGLTYEVAHFDYDINNDDNFGDGTIAGADPGENNHFLAFVGPVPPPGITLTSTGVITNEDTFRPIVDFICFCAGTLITTSSGRRAVEYLDVGDHVLTIDGRERAVRWVGSARFDAVDLEVRPKLRPVRIKSGALGSGTPTRDLMVSRQHRILVRSAIAQRMFGVKEVLVPAIRLTQLEGIEIAEDVTEATYFHILFDQHEVISSNGAWTESLFTGDEALKSVSPEARDEITALFPELRDEGYKLAAARHIPTNGRRIKRLVMRHAKNNKPVYKAERST